MFLFSGIFTPLSWIMNDSCKMIYAVPTQEGYNDYIKPQLTSFMPSTSSAAPSPSPPPAGGLGMPTISVENITLGCFNNVTLMTSMGMDKMFGEACSGVARFFFFLFHGVNQGVARDSCIQSTLPNPNRLPQAA